MGLVLAAPDEVLQQIDQMAVEFHWLRDEQSQWIETDNTAAWCSA